MRKQVLVFRALPDDLLARLREAHDVSVADPRPAAPFVTGRTWGRSNFIAGLKDAVPSAVDAGA